MKSFLKFSLLLIIFSANISTAQILSSTWLNPKPAGARYLDIDLSSITNAVAVGNEGVIVITTDSGNTWQTVESGTDNYLSSVSFTDQFNGFTLGENGIILKTTDGGFTWISQPTPTYIDFTASHFINSITGYAVGYETIAKYDNGSWTTLSHQYTSTYFFDVRFVNYQVGFACGLSGGDALLIKTTDGGGTWNEIEIPQVSGQLASMDFNTADRGWIISRDGELLRTTNGGNTWTLSFVTSKHIDEIEFKTSDYGLIVGEEGTVLESADSGKTWTNIHPLGITQPNYNSFDNSGTYILAVGDDGVINRSLNGGNSWSRKDENIFINSINTIQFLDSSLGFINVSENINSTIGIFKTTDGGISWNPSESGINENTINSMHFFSENLGFALTGDYLYKSTDAGNTWVEYYDFTQAFDVYSLFFLNQNIGWVLGGNEVYKTTNGGVSWTEHEIPAYNYGVNSIYFVNENRGFITQPNGRLLKSFDGGITWTREFLNISYALKGIAFTDDNNGWVAGYNGTLLRTTDGGVNWFHDDQDPDYDFNTIKFKNSLVGYIGGNNGALMYTTDGGNQWFNANSKFRSNNINSLEFIGQDNLYIGGQNGYLSLNTISDQGLYIQINTPNEGDNLTIGDTYNITWDSQNIDYVSIYYSTNNGINWKNIIYEYPASNGSYEWTVPYPRNNEIKIKVSAADNQSVSSESGTFSIDEPPLSWSALNYNTGNFLNDIAFTADQGWGISRHRVFRTTDDGDSWNEIYYNNSYWFKSILMHDDGSGIIAATEGKVFWTTDNGINWIEATTFVNEDLTCIAENSINTFIGGDNGALLMSTDGGEIWTDVYLDESHDIVDIEIPSDQNGYFILDYPAEDINEQFFYKTTDGGYSWEKTSFGYSLHGVKKISFVSDNVGYAINAYRILKTTDGGETWNNRGGLNFYPRDISFIDEDFGWISGFISVEVDGVFHSEAITIQTTDGGLTWNYRTNGIYNNSISKLFTLDNYTTYAMTNTKVLKYTGDETPMITVTSPNGWEYWRVETEHNITFDAVGIDYIKIDYSTNNGNTWSEVVSSVSSASDFLWNVPNTPSSECLVRVSSVDNPALYDISNNKFTIYDPTPVLDLTSPNGGEVLNYNDIYPITWEEANIYQVKIEYSIDGGNTWSQVISGFPASVGNYNWQVPNTPSGNCLIKIYDTYDAGLVDSSEAPFTINSTVQSLTIITPNGGDTLSVGSKYDINWSTGGSALLNKDAIQYTGKKKKNSKINSSEETANVFLEFSVDDGSNWIPIAGPVDAAANSYQWIVPNIPSNLCKVKIYDADDNSNMDISDAVFTISDDITLNNFYLSVDDKIGVPGDTVSLDFDLQIFDAVSFSSGLINVTGFYNQLDFLDADTSSGILSQFNSEFVVNDQDSLIKISFASASDIDSSGKLFSLKFLVMENSSGTVPVLIDSVLIDTGIYDVGIKNGSVQILEPFYGDVDLNSQVQPYDATVILKHLIGAYPPFNLQQQLNADVTIDETISAMDASIILQYTAELIDSLPHPFNIFPDGTIELPDYVDGNEPVIAVPVTVNNSNNVYSFEGSIKYDTSILQFENVNFSSELDGFVIQDTTGNEMLNFAAASSNGVDLNGTMMTFNFSKIDSSSNNNTLVYYDRMRLNEAAELTKFDSCLVDFTTNLDVSEMPDKFSLAQNYPNPFNPATKIRFTIPSSAFSRNTERENVSLIIYDILGNKVAALVNEPKSPGNYEIEFDGANLASGVYIYKLKAGSYSGIKKMILLK
ncbi:MAG: T9SS type A sorting domain-containing protein [Melioribacteraceae bacterium]|nr:T9SS type A sorting domain-containing protein [Melioribacteraceae bacterium]MCF8356011.1 T9SS type A sorting domain-containing protein [Melioribacteraceae bacterium]MCF8394678.1 T9SS type A sorting domain-containing protein [Melioribacteraceae bacterium]MCF8420244.1 T9SS type A sorting domain-containing protein [Melioribacteraceae bacterium]